MGHGNLTLTLEFDSLAEASAVRAALYAGAALSGRTLGEQVKRIVSESIGSLPDDVKGALAACADGTLDESRALALADAYRSMYQATMPPAHKS